MIIQYGYVVLFCVAFPLLPLLDLLVTAFVIKFFAARLCYITQRIFPRSNKQSNLWKLIIQTIGFIGILSNAAIIVFTTQLFDQYDLLTKI
mmetsp:Transcript_9857/g.1456  ORF Transcript_9857/g.1456 Transcript_9857/m.1456 type:complete len:91 (-) Transcript_9857:257-529(-)